MEVLSDLGSGINHRKRGLQNLLERILRGRIRRMVPTHKDRLLRFGSEPVFTLCAPQGIEVVVIHRGEPPSFEAELAQDVLAIITMFPARWYGVAIPQASPGAGRVGGRRHGRSGAPTESAAMKHARTQAFKTALRPTPVKPVAWPNTSAINAGHTISIWLHCKRIGPPVRRRKMAVRCVPVQAAAPGASGMGVGPVAEPV